MALINGLTVGDGAGVKRDRQNITFQKVCPNATQQEGPLESVSMYQTVDVLCEGEIEGLCDSAGNTIRITSDSTKNEDGFKGVYLNDVPVKNTISGTLNYNRTFADFRVGLENQRALTKFENPAFSFSNAIQTVNLGTQLPGLAEHEKFSERSKYGGNFLTVDDDGKEFNLSTVWADSYGHSFRKNFVSVVADIDSVNNIRGAEANQVVHANHTISNDSVDWVQINLSVGGLVYNHSDGDQSPVAVNFIIKTGYVDDELTIEEGGSVVYYAGGIFGISTSGYTRSHNLYLPPALEENRRDRFVKVFRIDGELTARNVKLQKNLTVETISEIVEQNLTYPYSALMGMIFDARAFSQPPNRRYDVKMTKVLVPNNYNNQTRQYRGNWDGNFATTKKWTDNPAWIFYDLATNERYGIGKYGFKNEFIDKWNLYSIAKYCDEFVPTGYSGKYSDLDFTCQAGGVIITINDSSTLLGETVLKQRYPEAGLVCFHKTKNASGTSLDKAAKRLIFNSSYKLSTKKFTFQIVKPPDVEEVFEQYPDIEESFLEQQKSKEENAYAYLLDFLTNQQNSTSDFVQTYMAGEPLDADITQGKATTQFHGLPLLEPRFSCNIYLDQKKNAFNALNDIAAIFRGMLYWSSGYIFASNDQAKEAVMLFTNANVADGSFIYSGSSSTSRATTTIVRYNDRDDSFKAKVEYVEDAAGIREFGVNEKEVLALGVTSKAQAHRLAKWMLYTNQTETDTVQFTTGQEGSYLKPGDVIKIQDKLKTSQRYGGRIKEINYAANSVTLDKGIEQNIVGQKITFIVPKENTTIRELNKSASSKLKIAVENQVPTEGVTTEEIDSTRQTQIKQFTIASVSETNVVTISETTDDDFNLIKKGFIWSAQNTSDNYKIEEVEYRVLSSLEQNFSQYQITAMMYNRSKFQAVDDQQDLTRTQQSTVSKVEVGSLPSALTGSPAPTSNIVKINKDLVLPEFDARFSNISTLGALQNSNTINIYLELDFSALALSNGVNSTNTGGYVVEVYKASGEKVRFSLEGYDNTSATVLIGDEKDGSNMTFEIYRYDPSKRINAGLSD